MENIRTSPLEGVEFFPEGSRCYSSSSIQLKPPDEALQSLRDQGIVLGARLDIDPATGLGEKNLFLQFKYEDTGRVWSYRVRNFRQPEIAKIEVVEE
ncbi:MAG: hypothetical protein LBI61_03130 [Puniceicoccales bacterium]|jgi:hypothetical protein|nr:hypothetical protein [Puniceicoccales bacterium]